MARRVLVTRPQPGAAATAARLAAVGFEPVVLPLSEIVGLPAGADASMERFDAIAVTSANALRHLPDGVAGPIRDKPVRSVGERTARAARDAGFRNVVAGTGDGARLAKAMADELGAGARVLYLAGRERRPDFEQVLAERSVGVQVIETYATRAVSPPAAVLAELAGGGAIWAATVFSPRGATALGRLAEAPELRDALRETLAACISDRAARSLGGFGERRILVSESPDEEGVLALLSSQS